MLFENSGEIAGSEQDNTVAYGPVLQSICEIGSYHHYMICRMLSLVIFQYIKVNSRLGNYAVAGTFCVYNYAVAVRWGKPRIRYDISLSRTTQMLGIETYESESLANSS